MKGYNGDIEELTLQNDNFRKVLYTHTHSQLVLMSLKPNEDIGSEVHEDNDQFFRFESGQGRVVIDGNEHEVSDGSAPDGTMIAEPSATSCSLPSMTTRPWPDST